MIIVKRMIFALLIFLFILSSVSCSKEENAQNKSHITGLGIDINAYQEYRGWVFYIDYNNMANLYRVKSNGENKTLVIDEPVYSFEIYEDKIFYTNWDLYLYSIDIYGGNSSKFYSINEELLADDIVRATKIQILDGWIYILDHNNFGELYKIKTDGTEKTYLNSDEIVKDFYVDEGSMYYLKWISEETETQLWRTKTDGSQNQQLMQEVTAVADYDENWIYYSVCGDDDGLYKVSFDGEDKYLVVECNTKFIKVFDDWIYYFNYSNGRGLYKVRTDGSEKTFIRSFRDLEVITDDKGASSFVGDFAQSYGIFGQWLLCYGTNGISAIKFGEPSETDQLTYEIISQWPNTTIYD